VDRGKHFQDVNGLDDLVELLTKGTNKGVAVAKPKWDFQDSITRGNLDKVFGLLNDLRDRYDRHRATGEINERNGFYAFHSAETRDLLTG